jgi:hypothetical protein
MPAPAAARPLALLALLVTACASPSATSSAPTTSGPPAATSTTTSPSPRPTTTSFVIPTQTPFIDPCKLTPAQISAVVGFTVVKKATQLAGQCEYPAQPEGGNVWFRVDNTAVVDLRRDKGDETFSLGGRYVTITDESGFPHEAFTAVKNPGDKSPGVIADAVVYLHPGQVHLRIYYPGGDKPPGRQHAIRLEHLMVG